MQGAFSLFRFNRAAILITAAAVSFATLSCVQSNSGPREEDRLEKAYALIDNGRETEAIELLQADLQKGGLSPRREEELKTALASAYVKKAGVPAQSFYDFARTWMETEDEERSFRFAARDEGGDQESGKRKDPDSALEIFETHGLEALAFVLKIKGRFDRLPEITADQDREMEKALGVLSTLRDPSRGAALYRGLVQTVRFKYRLKNGLYFTQLATSSKSEKSENSLSCVRVKAGYLLGLESLAADVELVLGDLLIAFPSQDASIGDALKAVGHARGEIARLRTDALSKSSIAGFDWNEVVRFVRLQFGWEWSCR